MSSTWREFDILKAYSKACDYKTVYRLAAMGVRKDGTIVFSTNGHAYFPACEKLIVKTGHAEQRLLRKLDKGATVYVIRLTRDGEYALAKPCSSCDLQLRSRRVKRVFYTISKDEYGVMEFPTAG